jgi:hypothetical protein
MFHHLALFITDTNVYVKDILLSTDPPLVRDILIFSDPPHNPTKLSFRANGHTKIQGAVLPNSVMNRFHCWAFGILDFGKRALKSLLLSAGR